MLEKIFCNSKHPETLPWPETWGHARSHNNLGHVRSYNTLGHDRGPIIVWAQSVPPF